MALRLLALLFMIVLAIPMFGMRSGFPDAGGRPEERLASPTSQPKDSAQARTVRSWLLSRLYKLWVRFLQRMRCPNSWRRHGLRLHLRLFKHTFGHS